MKQNKHLKEKIEEIFDNYKAGDIVTKEELTDQLLDLFESSLKEERESLIKKIEKYRKTWKAPDTKVVADLVLDDVLELLGGREE